jgi:hypothetical protein
LLSGWLLLGLYPNPVEQAKDPTTMRAVAIYPTRDACQTAAHRKMTQSRVEEVTPAGPLPSHVAPDAGVPINTYDDGMTRIGYRCEALP